MGGEQAPVLPEQSAAGIQRVLLELTPDQSGRFFDYEGRELPW